ncbi:MAG: hypothetical protein MHPSP_001271 [Paramarteilia canceri]
MSVNSHSSSDKIGSNNFGRNTLSSQLEVQNTLGNFEFDSDGSSSNCTNGNENHSFKDWEETNRSNSDKLRGYIENAERFFKNTLGRISIGAKIEPRLEMVLPKNTLGESLPFLVDLSDFIDPLFPILSTKAKKKINELQEGNSEKILVENINVFKPGRNKSTFEDIMSDIIIKFIDQEINNDQPTLSRPISVHGTKKSKKDYYNQLSCDELSQLYRECENKDLRIQIKKIQAAINSKINDSDKHISEIEVIKIFLSKSQKFI